MAMNDSRDYRVSRSARTTSLHIDADDSQSRSQIRPRCAIRLDSKQPLFASQEVHASPVPFTPRDVNAVSSHPSSQNCAKQGSRVCAAGSTGKAALTDGKRENTLPMHDPFVLSTMLEESTVMQFIHSAMASRQSSLDRPPSPMPRRESACSDHRSKAKSEYSVQSLVHPSQQSEHQQQQQRQSNSYTNIYENGMTATQTHHRHTNIYRGDDRLVGAWHNLEEAKDEANTDKQIDDKQQLVSISQSVHTASSLHRSSSCYMASQPSEPLKHEGECGDADYPASTHQNRAPHMTQRAQPHLYSQLDPNLRYVPPHRRHPNSNYDDDAVDRQRFAMGYAEDDKNRDTPVESRTTTPITAGAASSQFARLTATSHSPPPRPSFILPDLPSLFVNHKDTSEATQSERLYDRCVVREADNAATAAKSTHRNSMESSTSAHHRHRCLVNNDDVEVATTRPAAMLAASQRDGSEMKRVKQDDNDHLVPRKRLKSETDGQVDRTVRNMYQTSIHMVHAGDRNVAASVQRNPDSPIATTAAQMMTRGSFVLDVTPMSHNKTNPVDHNNDCGESDTAAADVIVREQSWERHRRAELLASLQTRRAPMMKIRRGEVIEPQDAIEASEFGGEYSQCDRQSDTVVQSGKLDASDADANEYLANSNHNRNKAVSETLCRQRMATMTTAAAAATTPDVSLSPLPRPVAMIRSRHVSHIHDNSNDGRKNNTDNEAAAHLHVVAELDRNNHDAYDDSTLLHAHHHFSYVHDSARPVREGATTRFSNSPSPPPSLPQLSSLRQNGNTARLNHTDLAVHPRSHSAPPAAPVATITTSVATALVTSRAAAAADDRVRTQTDADQVMTQAEQSVTRDGTNTDIVVWDSDAAQERNSVCVAGVSMLLVGTSTPTPLRSMLQDHKNNDNNNTKGDDVNNAVDSKQADAIVMTQTHCSVTANQRFGVPFSSQQCSENAHARCSTAATARATKPHTEAVPSVTTELGAYNKTLSAYSELPASAASCTTTTTTTTEAATHLSSPPMLLTSSISPITTADHYYRRYDSMQTPRQQQQQDAGSSSTHVDPHNTTTPCSSSSLLLLSSPHRWHPTSVGVMPRQHDTPHSTTQHNAMHVVTNTGVSNGASTATAPATTWHSDCSDKYTVSAGGVSRVSVEVRELVERAEREVRRTRDSLLRTFPLARPSSSLGSTVCDTKDEHSHNGSKYAYRNNDDTNNKDDVAVATTAAHVRDISITNHMQRHAQQQLPKDLHPDTSKDGVTWTCNASMHRHRLHTSCDDVAPQEAVRSAMPDSASLAEEDDTTPMPLCLDEDDDATHDAEKENYWDSELVSGTTVTQLRQSLRATANEIAERLRSRDVHEHGVLALDTILTVVQETLQVCQPSSTSTCCIASQQKRLWNDVHDKQQLESVATMTNRNDTETPASASVRDALHTHTAQRSEPPAPPPVASLRSSRHAHRDGCGITDDENEEADEHRGRKATCLSPTRTLECVLARHAARVAERALLSLYRNLLAVFRAVFGERYAWWHLGATEATRHDGLAMTGTNNDVFTTTGAAKPPRMCGQEDWASVTGLLELSFPRLKQRYNAGSAAGQQPTKSAEQTVSSRWPIVAAPTTHHPPPLDTLIYYNAFVQSLRDL